MADLLFKLKPGLDQAHLDDLLARIRAAPGVEIAAPIKRDAKSERMRLNCYARLTDDASVEDVAKRLRSFKEIASVEAPAPRTLPRMPN